jgi:hypothetical protein
MHISRGADNYSPSASKIQSWRVKIKAPSTTWHVPPHPTIPLYSSSPDLEKHTKSDTHTYESLIYSETFFICKMYHQGGKHSVEKISENSISRLKNLSEHKHSEVKPA